MDQEQEENMRKVITMSFFLQVVGTVAVVGILINNKRSLKWSKQLVADDREFKQQALEAICQIRSAGHHATLYPGIGVFVDEVRRIPSL